MAVEVGAGHGASAVLAAIESAGICQGFRRVVDGPAGDRDGLTADVPRRTSRHAPVPHYDWLSTMDKIRVVGGRPLEGTVRISGRRTPRCPTLCAALLTDQPVILRNVPEVRDIRTMGRVLAALGAEVEFRVGGTVEVQRGEARPPWRPPTTSSRRCAPPCSCSARCWRARAAPASPCPGGCAIGARPIDLHLAGPREDGRRDRGRARLRRGRGRAAARGRDLLRHRDRHRHREHHDGGLPRRGRDRHPQRGLRARGRGPGRAPRRAWARGSRARAGPTIRIEGVDAPARRRATPSSPTASRRAPSWPPCAIAGGDIEIRGCHPAHLRAVIDKFRETGVRIEEGPGQPARARPADGQGRRT